MCVGKFYLWISYQEKEYYKIIVTKSRAIELIKLSYILKPVYSCKQVLLRASFGSGSVQDAGLDIRENSTDNPFVLPISYKSRRVKDSGSSFTICAKRMH